MAERIVLLGIDTVNDLRQGITALLQSTGYVVYSLTTVAEMYQWLETNGKPDRIICDNFGLLSSDKGCTQDGYQFLLDLSRDPRYNDIPFGLFGGGGDDCPQGFGLAKPELPPQLCFWIPYKPFEADELLEAIRNCDGSAHYLGQAPQEAWNVGLSWLRSSPWPAPLPYDEDEHTRNWDEFITKCERERQAQVKYHPRTRNGWQNVFALLSLLPTVIDYQTYRPRVEFQGIRLHLPGSHVCVWLHVLSSPEEPLKVRLTRSDQGGAPTEIDDQAELAPALLRLLQLPAKSWREPPVPGDVMTFQVP